MVANFLVYEGYRHSIESHDGRRFTFIFEFKDEDEKIRVELLVQKFWNGETVVEPLKFNQSMKQIKSRMEDHKKNY